jgi:hypothetical protein
MKAAFSEVIKSIGEIIRQLISEVVLLTNIFRR